MPQILKLFWYNYFSNQTIGLYKGLDGASEILVLWQYNSAIDINQKSHATPNSAPLKVVDWFVPRSRPSANHNSTHCRNSPEMIISCMQDCKRIRHQCSSEYIMVSSALGGKTGMSRTVMNCSEVDQYRPASLSGSLDAAQGVCNCKIITFWF